MQGLMGEQKQTNKKNSRQEVICPAYAGYDTWDKQLTHASLWSCLCVSCVCFTRSTDPHAVPLHSNMLMYLCSALIGPSDARPAPPVHTEASKSVLQSGPRHCVRACSANVMQTNTLLFGTFYTNPPLWKKGSKVSKKEKKMRERNAVDLGRVLEFITVITWGVLLYRGGRVICQPASYPANFNQSANERLEKLVKVERCFEGLPHPRLWCDYVLKQKTKNGCLFCNKRGQMKTGVVWASVKQHHKTILLVPCLTSKYISLDKNSSDTRICLIYEPHFLHHLRRHIWDKSHRLHGVQAVTPKRVFLFSRR